MRPLVHMQAKKPIGRRPKQPPKDAADVIRKAAAEGATRRGISMALGCSDKVLQRWLDEREDLRDALEEGKEGERKVLHSVLRKAAEDGNIVAAMYLLKARHEGYLEGAATTQPTNKVSINFQLPGAMPFDPKMVIENEADDRTQSLSIQPARLTRGG